MDSNCGAIILECKRTWISVKPSMKSYKGSQLQHNKKVIFNKKLIDMKETYFLSTYLPLKTNSRTMVI